MSPFSWKILAFGFAITVFTTRRCDGESSTCLTVYKEGGAPAVFQSPKCPRWSLPNYDSRSRTTSSTASGGSRCQSAMTQGRRKSQEDRTLCALDIRIPFPGKKGIKEVMVGIIAVFDGHNGAEASEMASKLLLEYFALHTYFLLDATYSFLSKKSTGRLPTKGEKDVFQPSKWDKIRWRELSSDRSKFYLPDNIDDSIHLEILKEALLRAIDDIDSTFSEEAFRKDIGSGSTATIVLIADSQILVANIGDSKAFLCSEKFQSPVDAKATLIRLYREQIRDGAVSTIRYHENLKSIMSNGLARFFVDELTRDHHPNRDDEKLRVETSGGFVHERDSVSRVNGQLAVSRAIGDVHFKRYGVISAPEVTDWRTLTANDTFLVVASDGMFEKLSVQDVCDILWDIHSHGTKILELSPSCSLSLAECLVDAAFKKGSVDNVATVVVPLGSAGVPQNLPKERCLGEGDMHCPLGGLEKFVLGSSANDITSGLQLTHGDTLLAKFDRLLVEGKQGDIGCYYLSENLNNMDTVPALYDAREDYVENLPQALPEVLSHQYGGPLNLYNDLNFCIHFEMTVSGVKDQCHNPEGFANFLGLLESIPFLDAVSNYGSTENAMPDLRYVLKKRFGRGSYGEVWLAFYWNCHHDNNTSGWAVKDKNMSFSGRSNASRRGSSDNIADRDIGSDEEDLFVLKRIMVERGATVYLSGLREKYFGEVFLNASRCLRGLQSDRSITEWKTDSDDLLETNGSFYRLGNSWSVGNMFTNSFRVQGTSFEEGLNHIVRYVESFESRQNEIWLVFRHEGVSLSKLMYTVEEVEHNAGKEKVEEGKHIQVLHPSKWWHWLKTTKAGKEEMRNLIWQLLMALKSCHDRNITHRDIKPGKSTKKTW